MEKKLVMFKGFDEIEQKVKEIVKEVLQVKDKEIEHETTIDDLGGDSLSALGIISALEKEYDIDIPQEVVMKIDSFASIVNAIREILRSEGIREC